MGFIPSSASTGTQTMLEYKDSNYPLIALSQGLAQKSLTISS